ncbi:MAG: hypothetical protein IJ568_00880 [Bacilli bacterium]|nr:hypothetical protein [Bacilli bacterium]
MKNISNENIELMEKIKWKLKREYKKTDKLVEWLEDKDATDSKPLEMVTLGTSENIRAIISASLLPAITLSIGAVTATAGLVAGISTLGGPQSQAEIEVINSLNQFVTNMTSISSGAFNITKLLASLPLGITAISIPRWAFRELVTKIDDKTRNPQIIKRETVNMISDIIFKKKDDSLDFPREFLSRVDLKDNSKDYNLILLKQLAVYRYYKMNVGEYNITEEDSKNAYNNFIDLLETYKETKYVSASFRNNEYLNSLIEKAKLEEKGESIKK